MIELLEPYLSQSDDWFNDTLAVKASKAATGVLRWLMAIVEFHSKVKIVKPRIQSIRIAETRLELSQKVLEETREDLATIQDYVKSIEEEFSK